MQTHPWSHEYVDGQHPGEHLLCENINIELGVLSVPSTDGPLLYFKFNADSSPIGSV